MGLTGASKTKQCAPGNKGQGTETNPLNLIRVMPAQGRNGKAGQVQSPMHSQSVKQAGCLESISSSPDPKGYSCGEETDHLVA